MRSLLCTLCLIILASGSPISGQKETGTASKLANINLELKSLKSIGIDSLLLNPVFVPLETNEDCIIDTYDDIVITDDIIFILSNSGSQQAVFAFNLQGKFLFKIDAQGRGPGEYLGISAFYPNTAEKHLEIAAIALMKYGYDGSHLGNALNLLDYGTFVDFTHHEGRIYAFAGGKAIQFKSTGEITNALKVFSSDWKLIHEGYPVDMGIISSPFEIRSKYFFRDSRNAYFSYTLSDTIYQISGKSLNPRYLLDFGENALSFREKLRLTTLPQNSLGEFTKFFQENNKVVIGPEKIGITDNFIYLGVQYGYRGGLREIFYNRSNGNTVTLSSRRLFGPLYPTTIFCSDNRFFGIIEAKRIHDMSSGRYKTTPEADLSPFAPTSFPGFHKVSPEDNAVLVFFDIARF